MKNWIDMNDKERNEHLRTLGGCGNCSHWCTDYNEMKGSDIGCVFLGHNKPRYQVYDNGCEYILPVK
jgi:hypothetical protein